MNSIISFYSNNRTKLIGPYDMYTPYHELIE